MSSKRRRHPHQRQARHAPRGLDWVAVRDPVFARLDYYIARGYGDVSQPIIEQLIREHGGQLPEKFRSAA